MVSNEKHMLLIITKKTLFQEKKENSTQTEEDILGTLYALNQTDNSSFDDFKKRDSPYSGNINFASIPVTKGFLLQLDIESPEAVVYYIFIFNC